MRVFLLSPANAAGVRIRMVMRKGAKFPLALAVQSEEGAPLGDVFAFTSGLYFRGKRTYAERFGEGLVIAPGAGLLPLSTRVTLRTLKAFAKVPVDPDVPAFTKPLRRDAEALAARLTPDDEVVLLGSVATGKYAGVLLEVFGERLLFPPSFVGRGDMSRGGLLLRAAKSGEELAYAPVLGATVKGKRPPKLARLRRLL